MRGGTKKLKSWVLPLWCIFILPLNLYPGKSVPNMYMRTSYSMYSGHVMNTQKTGIVTEIWIVVLVIILGLSKSIITLIAILRPVLLKQVA